MVYGVWFMVYGLWFRVMVYGLWLWFRVYVVRFKVERLCFIVHGSGFRVRYRGPGLSAGTRCGAAAAASFAPAPPSTPRAV